MSTPKEVKRAQIQALKKAGISTKEICKQLNCSAMTVHRWKFKNNFKDKQRPGRPTVLSPLTKSKIENHMNNKISSTRSCTKMFNMSSNFVERNKKMSRRMVQRFARLTDWRKQAYRIRRRFYLSQKNIQDRKKFGRKIINDGFCCADADARLKLSHMIFTDEAPIPLHPDPNPQNTVIRTANRENVPYVMVPKHGLKIMIAGAISEKGKSNLIVIEQGKTVNGEYYKNKILPVYEKFSSDKEVFPNQEMITFQHDGATCHNTKANLNYLHSKYKTVWGKGVWPGNSPG